MDTDRRDWLTTRELAERWGVSRQRVFQRAAEHPDLLHPSRTGARGTSSVLWHISEIVRFEEQVLRPGGARRAAT